MTRARALAFFVAVFSFGLATPSRADDSTFELSLRRRVETAPGSGRYEVRTEDQQWPSRDTAVIVCDMWDLHHCLGATQRVQEIAPRMNEVLSAARQRGAFVIHAPSSCMKFYEKHPARKRAEAAPPASNLPDDIRSWCHWKDPREKAIGYPIDHTDGGEDDQPDAHADWYRKLKQMGRRPGSPWLRQIGLLEIDPDRDAITDSGEETWNLLEARGIDNVILMGVHTNMCVLGRPFGLRQMARNGKNVVLMRDMTDTMYNPTRRPYVSHFRGTDLVVEHIERMVCPTVTSDQILGGRPFRFRGDVRPRVVVAVAESHYNTRETLVNFAKERWRDQDGLDVVVVEGAPGDDEIPGFAAAVRDADVVVLSVRRRGLPEGDMAALRSHLDAGKSLIAIRTASHAFAPRSELKSGHVAWATFDRDVLGGTYSGHHAADLALTVSVANEALEHPIVRGLSKPFVSRGSLYKMSPLVPSARPLLTGTVSGHPVEPVAWVNSYGPNEAKVFYTSLGHPEDFASGSFLNLLSNALKWIAATPIGLTLEEYRSNWQEVCVPRPWKRNLTCEGLASYDGFAWYRCLVRVPAAWSDGERVTLTLGHLDDAHAAYVNGALVGRTGSFGADVPGDDNDRGAAERSYDVPAKSLLYDSWNTIAVRVLDRGGRGGIYKGEPALLHGDERVELQGTWELRVGDDQSWAKCDPAEIADVARFGD